MPRILLTFFGLAATLAWIQTSESLWIARDAALYNGCLAVATTFVIVLAALSLCGRLGAAISDRRVLAGSVAVAVASGVGAAFVPLGTLRLLALCIAAAAMTAPLIAWLRHLALQPFFRNVVLVCASGACATFVKAALLATSLAPGAMLGILSLCSGGCLIALAPPDGNPKASESRSAAGEQPSSMAASRMRFPWATLLLLCLSHLAVSVFTGMAASPYLANSQTIAEYSAAISFGIMMVLGIAAYLRLIRGKKAEDRQAPDEDGRAFGLAASPHTLIVAFTAVVLAILIIGLLVFAVSAPGTMIFALGVIVAAKHCLLAVIWIAVPLVIVMVEPPIELHAARLLLASGVLYATEAALWAGIQLRLSFAALTSSAVVLLVLIAAVSIAYAVLGARREQLLFSIGKSQQSGEAPPTRLDLDGIREALREYRLDQLAPYNLTERETEVVMLLIDGQTLGNIAEQLFISERTVKFHSKNAYEKLGVHGKKELMQMFSET